MGRSGHTSMRWRRHWPIVAALVVASLALVVILGDTRLSRLSSTERTRTETANATAYVNSVEGAGDLFDAAEIHSISVEFDQDDYDFALRRFRDDGLKIFIQGDVTIDGTEVQSVGLRLKGTSTIAGLGQPVPSATTAPTTGTVDAVDLADSPETLPWLVRFDEFVEGQRYQDHREIVVRPGGAGSTPTTGMNEVLTLGLLGLAGAPAERTSYGTFSVNGGPSLLRLFAQPPQDSFTAEHFDAPGALYKAKPGGSFAWRGDDPFAYEDSFNQETRRNQQDLAPVIDFIDFVVNSAEDVFAAELETWLDVEAFARYLAVHNLSLDTDDMAGPGQNYFLFFDVTSERFTVVSWDANASWAGDVSRGPYSAPEFAPGSSAGAGHILRDRFLAEPEFQLLYERTWRELHRELLVSGAALQLISDWEQTLWQSPVGTLTESALVSELADLRRTVNRRTNAVNESPWTQAADADLPLGPG